MIDIYHSRRGKFQRCVYWLRDTSKNIDRNKFVLENEPTGTFYAKIVNNIINEAKQVQNAMLFDRDTVTIETNDDILDIKKGSLVKFLDEIWFVENASFMPHNKESEFSNKLHTTTYLNLRK